MKRDDSHYIYFDQMTMFKNSIFKFLEVMLGKCYLPTVAPCINVLSPKITAWSWSSDWAELDSVVSIIYTGLYIRIKQQAHWA